jgi:hypothetical protein
MSDTANYNFSSFLFVYPVKSYIFVQNRYNMNKKKPYYLVIDLFDLRQSLILPSVAELSRTVGVHRNTFRIDPKGIYGHYLVVPYKLK